MINTNFNTNSVNFWSGNFGSFGSQNTSSFNVGGMFGSNMSGSSPAFQNSLIGLRRSADVLRMSLNNMRGIGRNAESPFGAIRAVSDDTDILNISSVSANRLRSANLNDFSVDVVQVAQAQRNEGTALNSNQLATAAGFNVGSNHIGITIGNQTFDINFNVSARDTARDVQNRIASAVNSRNIGVEASVSRDNSAGTSTLVLQSRETGVNNAGQPNFTVSSTAGNALAVAGVSGITQQAQNAQFRVNRGGNPGALQTSRSNDVDLGFGINAQLRAAGNVDIEVGRDDARQINAFRHMVNSFNDMVEAARDSAGFSGSRLERELSGLARSFSSSLNRVGISTNSSGFMSIDEDRMRRAAERGELESFASRDRVGGNSGFMNRLTNTADRVSRNPAQFMRMDNNIPGGMNFNARQLNQMNRLVGMGMLFETRI